ncbi:MAG TPA: glycosyltransferase family 4 protein [Bacteroidales bacterium]|nr:glycosyltransferase family 4 protein [Bacteroidales bacterium]
MKIIFVNTNKQWGGGEKWHFDAAKMLKNKGHTVYIMTGTTTGLYKKAVDAGIKVIPAYITNLSFLNPFALQKLISVFRQVNPDRVVLNFSADVKSAGLAARMAGISSVIYRRGNAKPVKNSVLNRFLFKYVITGMIANSEETKHSILKNNKKLFPPEKIKILYNGIHLGDYDKDSAKKLYERKGNEIILGTAGRLSAEKGHALLIEAMSVLKKNGKDFTLLVAGEGPELENLKNAARIQGIEEQVNFMGFVSSIRPFMNSTDIFILPSLWEGFGYVTIEAMAAGKPVIAFNTGSNPEIIEDTKTGLLVSPIDAASLAEKIIWLLSHPTEREAMGKNGRMRVEQLFECAITDDRVEKYLTDITI